MLTCAYTACVTSGTWTVIWVGISGLHTWDVRHHLFKRPLCPQLLLFQRTGRTALAEDIVWNHTFAEGFDGRHLRGNLIPNIFFFCTSEQGDERHQPVLLDHLIEFVAQVVVRVGLQGVFDQDPARHQQVVQPIRDVEDDPGWRQRESHRR